MPVEAGDGLKVPLLRQGMVTEAYPRPHCLLPRLSKE